MTSPKSTRVGLTRLVDWNDKSTPWDLQYSILKWCDGQAGNWFHAPNMPAAVSNLYDIWTATCVTRVNTIKINSPNTMWPDQVDVEVWCSRVGNSTWDMSHVFTDNRSNQPVILASAVNTLCSVDDTLTKSKPVPHADQIKQLVMDPPFKITATQRGFERPTGSDSIYTSEAIVRLVDCDALGHVNNAKYMFLTVDALNDAFANHTMFKHMQIDEALGEVDAVHLSYMGQMKPNDRYSFSSR